MALAIELAARRVGAYGLQQTAALLDQRLTLLWAGPRTAPPRQKTLQATLDWSYGLLSEVERAVLRRLAVFVGHFTLDAALAVVTSTSIDHAVVFAAIDGLVAKSMIATAPIGAMMRYRLLDTTRAYVLAIPIGDADAADLAVRHATYYRRWLEQNGPEWPTLSNAAERILLLAGLNNVRAALGWCFGQGGDAATGVELASAAAPVFLSLSLLTDCHRWSERAILAMRHSAGRRDVEMGLHAALAMSLMFTRGNDEATGAALARGLAIAAERRDTDSEVYLLGLRHLFHTRIGDYRTARRHAERMSALGATLQDPAAVTLAHALLGCSLHLAGELGDARAELEAAERQPRTVARAPALAAPIAALGLSVASSILARTLWLQGYPVQAMQRVRQSVRDAENSDQLVTLMSALTWAVSQLSGMGALDAAEEYLDRLVSHADSYSLSLYFAVGRGYRGKLAIQRGHAESGIDDLRACVDSLHAARHEVMVTPFNIALAQGLSATGRSNEGLTLTDETISRVEANGDLVYMPELLRVKGSILLSMPEPACGSAELCFQQSLELSRRYGALAWELRTAAAYAELLLARGRSQAARENWSRSPRDSRKARRRPI